MTNKVFNCDCLQYMKDIPDNHFDLCICDPPYNINKAEWDKVEDYINWMTNMMIELQRIMKDNSSTYFFHNDFSQLSRLQCSFEDNTNFILRQFIVWNKRFKDSPHKGYFDGHVAVEGLRNYKKMAEYICFYTFQDETGLSKIMDSCVYPIRDYIRKEIIRAKGKIIFKDINSILGTATNGGGVASAVLSEKKTVPAMITKEHYEILRKWLNNGTEYEALRTEYEDLRYTFNNQKTHHSIWDYDIQNSWHPTPKPRALIMNILKHSTNKDSKIFNPFNGSEIIRSACYDMGLYFEGCEKDEKIYNEQEKRFQEHIAQAELFGTEELQTLIYKDTL